MIAQFKTFSIEFQTEIGQSSDIPARMREIERTIGCTLRLYSVRPRDHHATEQTDEFAAPHAIPDDQAMGERGIVGWSNITVIG
jgi:hypothetical protein